MLKKTVACLAVVVAFAVAQAHAQTLPAAAQGDAIAGYNPTTGVIFVSANQVLNWVVQKKDESDVFLVANVTLPNAVAGQLETKAANVLGIGTFSPPGQTFVAASLGRVLAAGLRASDFFIGSEAAFGSPQVRHDLVALGAPPIPEPMTLTLVGMVGLTMASRRRR